MQASDVMTANVITVAPDTPVRAVAEILLENRISAVPVVDEDGRLLGIVSEGDLIRQVDPHGVRSWWLRVFSSPSQRVNEYLKSHGTTAAHVMTKDVVTVGEAATLGEVAELLEERQIKRVPVMRDDKIVGIVSRSNLLQGLVARSDRLESPPPADDRSLRSAIMKALRHQDWLTHGPPNPIVTDGVCELWGAVATEEEREAVKVLVAKVPGVRAVRDHLVIRSALPEGPGYV